MVKSFRGADISPRQAARRSPGGGVAIRQGKFRKHLRVTCSRALSLAVSGVGTNFLMAMVDFRDLQRRIAADRDAVFLGVAAPLQLFLQVKYKLTDVRISRFDLSRFA